MNWYYVDQGQQAGPVDDAGLDELVRSGKVQPSTLVWREGMANWIPYSQARAGAAAPASPPASAGGLRLSGSAGTGPAASGGASGGQAVCAECGGAFPIDNMIRHGNAFICANCKPVFMQKLAEGAKVDVGELNYAGFWIRFAAKFIDGLIIGVVVFAPMFVVMFQTAGPDGEPNVAVQMIFQLAYMAINGAYNIFFVGKYGATPGKMACGLRIVDGSGARIGFGRATGRFFAEILSGMICYIGYIMVAFDSEKRGLHDRICNTRVVYK